MRCLVAFMLAAAAALARAQALPAGSAIPFKTDSASAASHWGGAAVLLVSLIVIGAVLFLRKRLPGALAAPGKLVKVLESRRMGGRAMLFVVEFGGQHHLVAHSEHGVSCLAVAAPSGEAAP